MQLILVTAATLGSLAAVFGAFLYHKIQKSDPDHSTTRSRVRTIGAAYLMGIGAIVALIAFNLLYTSS